jgi:hypothetical protein
MDEMKYNASHAPDPVARKAIHEADKQPKKVRRAVKEIKRYLGKNNLALEGRITILDKDTGHIYR